MALFHKTTLHPTKLEMITAWLPAQPWSPPRSEPVELIGSFRFEDPEGRVGLETHLLTLGDEVVQVPLTYRDAPLDGVEDGLVGTMEHGVLGTRWVYDGLTDPRYLMMLAAVTMTGQGEALGLAELDAEWYVVPAGVRITGGGWGLEPASVDGFERVNGDRTASTVAFRNERFELCSHRLPVQGPQPPIGLTATWEGVDAPAVLAEVTERLD